MKEREEGSSVWEQFREAKKHAISGDERSGEATSIEELEAAIAEAAAQSGLSETGMPPRSAIHPNKRSQLSRWFYLTLVILFTLLVAGLFWWGSGEGGQ
ncbi:hypothetical protein [Cohnella sp. GCM10027633]|uniref:hypothetical protein n=1 Tax=unclassified Cohnella TaxID=2636738 RepID=UPI0036391DEA